MINNGETFGKEKVQISAGIHYCYYYLVHNLLLLLASSFLLHVWKSSNTVGGNAFSVPSL